MKKTQRKIIEEKLKADGEVTNLWAFEHHMLRLGAIIHALRIGGWQIDGDFVEGSKNFRYRLLKRPTRKDIRHEIVVLPSGERKAIPRWVEVEI